MAFTVQRLVFSAFRRIALELPGTVSTGRRPVGSYLDRANRLDDAGWLVGIAIHVLSIGHA